MTTTVLISSNNKHIMRFFENTGIPLARCATADTLLERLSQGDIRAVILTEELPDATPAMEILRTIRKELDLATLPVTIFSDSRDLHEHVRQLNRKEDPHLRIADSTTDLPTLALPYLPVAA